MVDEAVEKRLLSAGMDQRLAAHFAHIFIRDPLVVYDKDLEDKADLNETRYLDMMQSANWQTLRLKTPAPPPGEQTGWRVEVRPMEVQITDFENAAFSIFVVLLAQTILHFNLNLYIPISKIDENMETAHARNAVVSRRFFFRREIMCKAERPDLTNDSSSHDSKYFQDQPLRNTNNAPVADEYRLMSINEIINGASPSASSPLPPPSQDAPPGLIPLIHKYLDTCTHYSSTTRSKLNTYLSFIAQRASGQIPTTATWLRSFVQTHPEYKSDSVIGAGVEYDLVKRLRETSEMDSSYGWTAKLPRG